MADGIEKVRVSVMVDTICFNLLFVAINVLRFSITPIIQVLLYDNTTTTQPSVCFGEEMI